MTDQGASGAAPAGTKSRLFAPHRALPGWVKPTGHRVGEALGFMGALYAPEGDVVLLQSCAEKQEILAAGNSAGEWARGIKTAC